MDKPNVCVSVDGLVERGRVQSVLDYRERDVFRNKVCIPTSLTLSSRSR